MIRSLTVMVIFFQLLPALAWSQTDVNGTTLYDHERGFTIPMGELEVESMHQKIKQESALEAQGRMSDIKYFMLGGNLERAKLLLLHAGHKHDFSAPLQLRYQAMIKFIEGDYQGSLDILNHSELSKFVYLKKICLLKSLNLAILGKDAELNSYWPRCREVTAAHTNTFHLWIETLISLRTSKDPATIQTPFRNLAIENTKGDFLRIYLKLALYLNAQNVIFPRLPFLSIDVFKNDELRELLGLLFYRDGQLVNTYSFIEDLDTPNSENIKGNIYLAQKKYELAYAQFKLALQKKSNSTNALERAIPVAWKLRQWQDGINFLVKFEVDQSRKQEKEALIAAFLLQLGQFELARDTLLGIVQSTRGAQSTEVNKLLAYTYLELKDKDNALKYAQASCQGQDAMGCWLIYQLDNWEDFTLTVHRDDKVLSQASSLVEEYKSGFKPDPIMEQEFITQKDIEELEASEGIKLLPLK